MIPLARPYFDHEELEEIEKVLKSGWVSQGPKVKEFETTAASRLGAANAIAVSNCTTALHLALLSLNIGSGDEVLVADFTYPATGHSVLYCGAKPIFIDVDPKTYNIDTSQIKAAITEKTKAVIPVHTFGQPADMDELMEIARANDLKVIEDAACSFGATYKDRCSGTIGDLGCFSFHARKGITTGEGGMVVTDDKALADRVRYLSVFGMKTAWEREGSQSYSVPEFHDVGYNYKMSDINAAVGVAQLRKLDRIIAKKRELARIWDEMIADMKFIDPPFGAPDRLHIYQSYVAKLDPKVNRNRVIAYMKARDVQAQIGTYASHIQPAYHYEGKCPVSLSLHNQTMALPFFYEMTEEQIAQAGAILKHAIGECV